MRKSKKILIIDDSFQSIQTMVDIIEETDLEFTLFSAISGKLALKILENETPNLILLDWQMPEMSGMELLKKIKENQRIKNIPVVIVTGIMTNSANLFEAFNMGAEDFIRKPIDKLEFTARIKSIFKIQEYQNKVLLYKDKELALHATYLMQSKEQSIFMLKKLEILYSKINESVENASIFLKEMLEEMYSTEKMKSQNNFVHYFSQLHPEFTKQLTDKFPELTPSEIRMCTLLRMNMDTKAIASLLFKTEGSVKTSRKRLRAKLKLHRTDNLVNYISSV